MGTSEPWKLLGTEPQELLEPGDEAVLLRADLGPEDGEAHGPAAEQRLPRPHDTARLLLCLYPALLPCHGAWSQWGWGWGQRIS